MTRAQASNSPRFPLYIPSKGRSEYMITSRILTGLGVPHYIIVEPQDLDLYAAAIEKMELLATPLVLKIEYKKRYELCDSLGLTKSTGPGPARNFAWDHSIAGGFAWHWVMDDNITSFRRLNLNEKVKVSTGAIFRAMEDFCLRYRNVAMAGPNYFMFASARTKMPAFTTNTRIYSCNLIRNEVPFRWRGRYNEDTILSLDMLKARYCTVQFNAFLQEKMPTQTIGGGNTAEFYHAEGKVQPGQKYADTGTLLKSKMLVDVHPDVARMVWRFNRIHHYVDYSRFKKTPLVRLPEYENLPKEADNFGMILTKKD